MLNRAHIDEAVRALVRAESDERQSLINTPLLYPGGTTVALRVTNGSAYYTVTDMGIGYDEASSFGAGTIFARQAKVIAEDAGVDFHDHTFGLHEVSADQLTGAVMAVANCSQAAVIIAADHQTERDKVDEITRLVRRLERVFKAVARVETRQQILGSSLYPWRVDALVEYEERRSVFDAVTPHPQSVLPTAAKFHDLSLLEGAPACFASIRDQRELGALHAVLAQTGNIIDAKTPNFALQKMVGLPN